MATQYQRTEEMIGSEGLERLKSAKIILFGVGGVGSFAGEALIRAGIGTLAIVDHDTVALSNLNRQLIALYSTLDMPKVTAAQMRYADIDSETVVIPFQQKIMPENIASFNLEEYDYVIDAVDMVTAKLAIIEACCQKNIPVISCMGTGNKMKPALLEIASIEKTSVCPLARVMRKELKNRGISGVKTVFSKEEPVIHQTPPGSMCFVPGAAGLMIAGEVISDLLGK